MRTVRKLIDRIGYFVVDACFIVGQAVLFFTNTVQTVIGKRIKFVRVLEQVEHIGFDSLIIAIVTGAFAGAVIAYQSFAGFHKFGGESLLGAVVALTLTRELGPVLTGLMVTGRAGSSIAAEIGTMRITEQIDALSLLGIDPYQYLVVPTILGATLAMPVLALCAMFSGIVGAYIISVYILGLTPDQFTCTIREHVEVFDIVGGLIKSAVFGLIFSWVGCYKGFYAHGGARGVGLATTQSVVLSSILIIVGNYFLAILIFGVGQ